MGDADADTTSPAWLVCPSCRSALTQHPGSASCPTCNVAVPVANGFVLWTERFIDSGQAAERSAQVTDGSCRYQELLERKFQRAFIEPYAWFRPFNESTRSLEPLRNLIGAHLSAGAPILDTWCRTGWTGEMLASWFPDNPVISLWEGDKDQLGYQGFLHWLPEGERASNLSVVFASPTEPLPFADDYFAFVHGLDTLHRYPSIPLIGECLRVSQADAPIIFPHVHLTNSEPVPFFERGCTQLAGATWKRYFDGVCEGTSRSAWVLSERDLYLMHEPMHLVDDCNTGHYNALVAIGPSEWQRAPLIGFDGAVHDDCFLLVNPLLTVDSVTGTAVIDHDQLSGTVGYMADRHPVTIEALAPLTDRTLHSRECQILAHCDRPLTLASLAARLHTTTATLVSDCAQLIADNALQFESVSAAMANLQNHYVHPRPERKATFASLWGCLATRYGERPMLVGADGSTFDFADADTIVQALRHWLADQGVCAGDRVAIVADNHLEYFLTVWASWLSGLVAVPLSPDLPPDRLAATLDSLAAAVVICDDERWEIVAATRSEDTAPLLILDPTDAEPVDARPYLLDIVPDHFDREPLLAAEVSVDDTAAIIFTSGSTGQPKAVELRMDSLLFTADTIASALDLVPSDLMWSMGQPHTMSGLRNPFVAGLRAGATIVVDPESAGSSLGAIEAIGRHGATVVIGSPALIAGLASITERVRPNAVRALRLIASTADRLDQHDAALVAEHYDVQVIDYYGMTETGGICVVSSDGAGALGRPRGAAVEVYIESDDRRAEPGEIGELRISGPGMMKGYLSGVDGVRFESGWIYTGDLAVPHLDGSLDLIGRAHELIKTRSGEIYPHHAVISALATHGIDAAVSIDESTRQILLELGGTEQQDNPERWARDLLSRQFGKLGLPDRVKVRPNTPSEAT